MSVPHRTALVLVTLLALVAGGCGGGTKAKKAKAEKPIEPAEVDPSASVPVDGGRVTVSPPVDWRREPRSKDYLARYLPGGGKTYPSVTVLGGDPPGGITAVEEANHADFVAAVAASLAEQFTNAEGKSTLIRKPAAIELGPHKAVVWTAPGTAKVDGLSQQIERSCSAIVLAGRMYTVEARAPKGKLDDTGRAAGRGVAAGIALPEAAEPEPQPEPDAPAKPDESPKPAPAEPADDKPATDDKPAAEEKPAPADAPAPAEDKPAAEPAAAE